jgi:hypothetical protein
MTVPVTRSVRWFLAAGCIGFMAAVSIAVIKPNNPVIVLLLWPAAIVGIADPKGLLEQAVFGIFMFGGNFVLYGALGAAASVAADRLHR